MVIGFGLMQVTEPEDFRSWRETMVTEFPGRFMRLFAGPMWSGQSCENRQDPRKVFTLYTVLIFEVSQLSDTPG